MSKRLPSGRATPARCSVQSLQGCHVAQRGTASAQERALKILSSRAEAVRQGVPDALSRPFDGPVTIPVHAPRATVHSRQVRSRPAGDRFGFDHLVFPPEDVPGRQCRWRRMAGIGVAVSVAQWRRSC